MTTRGPSVAAARNQILDAAVEEILEVGLGSFNLQNVALRADVAARTVYNHFPGRDELLNAAFSSLADRAKALAADVEEAADTPVAQLQSLIEHLYRVMDGHGGRLTAVLALRDIEELDKALAEVRAVRRDQLTRILRAIEHENGLAVPVPQAVALAYALSSHATWHALTSECGLSTSAAERLVMAALQSALGIAVSKDTAR